MVPSLLAAETVQLRLHCGLQPGLYGRDPQVLWGCGSVLLPGVLPSLNLRQLPPAGWEPPLQPSSPRGHQEAPVLVPGWGNAPVPPLYPAAIPAPLAEPSQIGEQHPASP